MYHYKGYTYCPWINKKHINLSMQEKHTDIIRQPTLLRAFNLITHKLHYKAIFWQNTSRIWGKIRWIQIAQSNTLAENKHNHGKIRWKSQKCHRQCWLLADVNLIEHHIHNISLEIFEIFWSYRSQIWY
jgi:hypothetical protein